MDAPPKLNLKLRTQKSGALLPEVEVYLQLLLLIHLLDGGMTKEVRLLLLNFECNTFDFVFILYLIILGNEVLYTFNGKDPGDRA